MKAHATCGRGTEIFAKEEVVRKLQADVLSVEDGKIFFTVNDSTKASKVQELKTVERVFATVAHFPTAKIKGNGKVKFLHDLKSRVLDHSTLMEAANSVRRLSSMCSHEQKVNSCKRTTSTTDSLLINNENVTVKSDSISSFNRNLTFETSAQTLQNICGKVLHSKRKRNQTMLVSCRSSHSEQSENVSVISSRLEKDQCRPDCLCRKHQQGSGIISIDSSHIMATSTSDFVCDMYSYKKSCDESKDPHRKRSRVEEGEEDDIASILLKQEGHPDNLCSHLNKTEVNCMTTAACPDMSMLPLQQSERREDRVTFRISVKCAGWCRKWLQPQRLAKECGQKLSWMLKWKVDLHSPEIEICIHINDDFITAGIPLIQQPLSKRSYILEPGLRSTIAWIIAHLAQIQPGDYVLDPMCGKATILLEAAKHNVHGMQCTGCDIDKAQLHAACRNIAHADLMQSVTFIHADATNLPLRDETVDKIVCDAPFGQKFTISSGLSDFYRRMLKELYRVLIPGGRLVLLTSQDLQPMVKQCTQHSFSRENPPLLCNMQFDNPVDKKEQVNPLVHAPTSTVFSADGCMHKGFESEEKNIGQSDPSMQTLSQPCSCQGTNTEVCELAATMGDTSSAKQDLAGGPSVICDEDRSVLTAKSVCAQPQLVPLVHTATGTLKSVNCISGCIQKSVIPLSITGEERKEHGRSGQFSITACHYVKLGETHAYIMVIDKLQSNVS